MATHANFGFFNARQEFPVAGIKVSELLDPYGDRKGTLPSLVVGPQVKMKADKPVKWAKVIPPGLDTRDLPQFDNPRRDENKLMRGSIVTVDEGGKKKTFLVSHRDSEGAYYILVRTGLMVRYPDGKSDNGMTDRMDIQKDHELVSHGSYSFDKGSVRIATANNEDAIKELDGLTTFTSSVAAERMRVQAFGKKIPLIGGGYCPRTSYVLWKMPIGAVLLVREVNGKLTRLVAQKDTLRRVDASSYAKFFPILEEAYIKARRAEIEARKAAAVTSSTAT